MYREMVYALDDVLDMKFKCTELQKRMIIRDVIKSKKNITDPTIYLYEAIIFDGTLVLVDHSSTHVNVQKCLYYTFQNSKKRSCKVDIRNDQEAENLCVRG